MAYQTTHGKIVYVTNFSHSLGVVGRYLEDGNIQNEGHIGGRKIKLARAPQYDLHQQNERTAMLECIAELAGALSKCREQIQEYADTRGQHRYVRAWTKEMTVADDDAETALTRAEQFLKGQPE